MEENVIKLFMWGYQKPAQVSLQTASESLFNGIDRRLRPNVFLIGILVEDKADRHPVCFEPEDCGYSVGAFAEIKKLAKELEKVDEGKKVFHSHPIAQKNHEERISNHAYIEAISKILKRQDVYGDYEKFISFPTYVEGYLVFVVLEIQKEAMNRYYSLTKEEVDDRYAVSRSFIESSIYVFLEEATNALKDPNKGMGFIDREPDELLRKAAKEFMLTISQAGRNFEGLHGLNDAIDTIASLKYEGAEGLGKMIIARRDHPNIRITLELEEPINISDFRKVRKFLELSNETSIIISDSALIYGLGELTGKYNPKEESLFIINFISHFKWEVLHANNSMMVVEYKQPRLPKEKIDRDKFYSDFRRVFNGIETKQIDNLWDITNQATEQMHGTMLVITDNAKKEAIRLGKQSFALKPLKLTTNIIPQITSIDGSVLLDRNCECHAIGVILDGLATDKGDSSRGARYNSAVRYYEQFGKENPTVLVIISEDGMINLIPNLRPQIKHSEIIEAIEMLKKLSEAEKFEHKRFYLLMYYFKSIEFYLTKAECEQINQLRKKTEEKNTSASVRIVLDDLKPDREMSTSYYL